MAAQANRLAIGTAQFGLDYGITNQSGQVPLTEVVAILEHAGAAGVDTLDTARLYGSSEEVIGQALSSIDHQFSIVTKTGKHLEAETASQARDLLLNDLRMSLDRLKQPSLHALLAHDAEELLGPMGQARWAAMEEARDEGLVTRIGASLYGGSQLEAISERYTLDIVQLPLNAIDHRLVGSEILQRVADAGTRVHARSVFLQGLLLADKDALPAPFSPLGQALDDLDHRAAEYGVSRLTILLAALIRLEMVERIVIGMTTRLELSQILEEFEVAACLKAEATAGLPEVEDWLLDPRRWPSRN